MQDLRVRFEGLNSDATLQCARRSVAYEKVVELLEQAPIEKANALLMDVTMQLSIGYKKSLKSIRRIRRLVPNAPHPEALMRWASYHALGWISNNDPAKLGMLQAD